MPSFTANAVLKKPGRAATFTADARIAAHTTLRADAVIRKTNSSGVTAYARLGDFFTVTADAVITSPTQTSSFAADAVIFARLARSLTANALILPRHFQADSVIQKSFSASVVANAHIVLDQGVSVRPGKTEALREGLLT